jgi:hypothetical protein
MCAMTVTISAGHVAAETLDPVARGTIVDKLATLLRERYVYPELGAKAADVLLADLHAHAYDKIDDPDAFAARLTSDMSAIAHDKHLKVVSRTASYDPPPPSEAGVVRADRLAGGLGYVEVVSFPPRELFKPVIDKAMAALAGSHGLILDLRRNTGGDPAAVAYFVSFLLPSSTRVHINDIVKRRPATLEFGRDVYQSEPTPVGFAGKPVIVLTSAATFSGGEEFAYDVQSLGVATVIGERTGGGANPTEQFRLGGGLAGLVPYGRAENPITKTNWEGRGVSPTVVASAGDTLRIALARLGDPGAQDITAASRERVFAPRATPMPGSEAALRKTLTDVAQGKPDYATMTPHAVETTNRDLNGLRAELLRLGPVRAMRFVSVDEFGGDVYDVTFSSGPSRCAIGLDADGKIYGWGILGPPSE